MTRLSGDFNVCACMGTRMGQPYCPCEMQRRGLSDGKEYAWTQEDKDRLMEALREMAELMPPDGEVM